MKLHVMTLQEAEAFLKESTHPVSAAAIRQAILDDKLRANLVRKGTPYYTVVEDDLLEWAANPDMHPPKR